MPLPLARLTGLLLVVVQVVLALAIAAYLASFTLHAGNILGYPYPLDYGEGPLLAQIERLRGGTPIWQLYADTSTPPYLVVNYPPFYLLLATALSWLTGDGLLAGRLISLLATLGCVVALVLLPRNAATQKSSDAAAQVAGQGMTQFAVRSTGWLVPLIFLTIPVVREWGVLLRVDMLGICLGLWGLYYVRVTIDDVRLGIHLTNIVNPLLAGFLFVLCLYTKPSLLAAPAAGCCWLLGMALFGPVESRWALWRASVVVVGVLGLGGVLLGLLHWASGGWFWLHVVTANANRWEWALATGFWREQLRLRWPLLLAAALAVAVAAVGLWRMRGGTADSHGDQRYTLRITHYGLPLLFTLFSLGNVVGVGKVGAYANYFLEFYAGLLWLIAATLKAEQRAVKLPSFGFIVQRSALSVLLLAALLYYPPLWDANRLRPAGLLEPSPPRLAFGSYGLWDDLARESELLAAQRRIHGALLAEVQAVGAPLFTDMPGLAAAAGVTSRITVFEQRQLYDQGEWDQRPLLVELANGRLPLVVLDYLGNWLTPEMVSLIKHRYAQDGSLGTYDIYRPVNPGPRQPADLSFPNGLRLSAVHIAPPAAAPAYEPGQLLTLGLEWREDRRPETRDRGLENGTPPITVSVQLVPEGSERPLALSELPLLYGVFPPGAWPADAAVQHMQTLQLPTELPAGRYRLALSLRTADGPRESAQPLASITVAGQGGRWFDETSYFVPGALLAELEEQGGVARLGLPLTPAVPFGWGLLQCFERACLEWRNNAFAMRPLGELLYMAETRRNDTCLIKEPPTVAAQREGRVCPSFAAFWQNSPELNRLGPIISGEVPRNGLVVQWTRYLRLERNPATGDVLLGRLGDDYLRLPPGVRYRWP